MSTVVATTAPLLAASGLRKTYGRGETIVRAVDGVDLELAPGELVAIMGASGSGKTTLLHLLAGLIRPDGGSIQLEGRDLTRLPDRQVTHVRSRRIGVVFQAYNLMPTLTALDNTALPLLLAGTPRAAARATARQRLGEVGLGAEVDRRPARLSGGEQQRVALARALIHDPQIVLADEPTGNLDRRSALAVCQLLREVVASPARSVAIVTHEPLVAAFADRVVVLADGRVADSFSSSEVDSAEAIGRRCLRVSEGG